MYLAPKDFSVFQPEALESLPYFNLKEIEEFAGRWPCLVATARSNANSHAQLSSDEQLQYEQKILEYEQEIEKLSRLVDELGNTYRHEMEHKEERQEEERQELQRDKAYLYSKEKELAHREQEIEELFQLYESRVKELHKEVLHLEKREEDVKQMDGFLKAKIEEMELLEKQLNQRSAVLDALDQQMRLRNQERVQSPRGLPYGEQLGSGKGDQLLIGMKIPLRKSYQQEQKDAVIEETSQNPQRQEGTPQPRNIGLLQQPRNIGPILLNGENMGSLLRKLSRPPEIDLECDNRVDKLAKAQASNYNHSYDNFPNSPKHQRPSISYPFIRSYAQPQMERNMNKNLRDRHGVTFEHGRMKTEHILTHVQPREKTKKKGEMWSMAGSHRKPIENDSKLLEVGSKLDRLRQEIRHEIEAVRK